MSKFYDPRNERPPSSQRNLRRQSAPSVALEALAGGLVIALIIIVVKRLLG